MLLAILMTSAVLGASVTPAAPAASPATGTDAAAVLRIDGPDVYVDLGRAAGIHAGDHVRVLRAVRVVRAGGREPLVDRFVLGELELVEVGQVLARARPDPQLARRLRIGDLVEPSPGLDATAAKGGATPASPATSAQECARPGDPQALAFREAWVKAQALPTELRATHWEAYLASNRDAELDEPLRREIAELRGAAAATPAPPPLAQPALAAPARAFEGDPLEVVLTFPEPAHGDHPRAAVLNWRAANDALYRPVAFSAEGPTWRARLPTEAAQAPGLDYWVGVVDASGAERALAGSGADPRRLAVRMLPGQPPDPRSDRSEVETRTDFADWNKFKGNDFYYSAETDYLYRVQGLVHSIKLGMGVYQGVGESLKQAIEDEHAAAGGDVHYRTRPAGYDYVFTDLDLRASETLGFVVRGLAGVNRDGFGAGVEGKIRIGREPGTHLVVGSGFTAGIGNRNELTLAWDQVRGWPMAASVIVTNEPVHEDYGVRFVYQVGRSVTSWLDLSLRAGYQLRDINHTGFGLGLATNFHW